MKHIYKTVNSELLVPLHCLLWLDSHLSLLPHKATWKMGRIAVVLFLPWESGRYGFYRVLNGGHMISEKKAKTTIKISDTSS